jgi:hypothetical protein
LKQLHDDGFINAKINGAKGRVSENLHACILKQGFVQQFYSYKNKWIASIQRSGYVHNLFLRDGNFTIDIAGMNLQFVV